MGSRGEGWPRMNADETLAALGSGSEFDPSHRLDTHVRGEFLVRKHLDGWSAISTKCRSFLRASRSSESSPFWPPPDDSSTTRERGLQELTAFILSH
jgi:hypothetical protein